MAAVGDCSPSKGSADRTGGASAVGENYRWQRSWPLVSSPVQGPFYRAFECVLQIARASLVVLGVLAQPIEPPCTDPYARWCGRGGGGGAPPPPRPPGAEGKIMGRRDAGARG